jgi:hypothetical protein
MSGARRKQVPRLLLLMYSSCGGWCRSAWLVFFNSICLLRNECLHFSYMIYIWSITDSLYCLVFWFARAEGRFELDLAAQDHREACRLLCLLVHGTSGAASGGKGGRGSAHTQRLASSLDFTEETAANSIAVAVAGTCEVSHVNCLTALQCLWC